LPYIVEAGINCNGDVTLAIEMIYRTKAIGAQYIKFQKRNPDVCVPEAAKGKMRDTPWGRMTYLEYKHRTEFSKKDYHQIDDACKQVGITWFASVWDMDSLLFMKDMECSIVKIPSAKITDKELCVEARRNFDTVMISTGMSDQIEVDTAIIHAEPNVVFHSVSCYPCEDNNLNLGYIETLKRIKSPKFEVGYSGHEGPNHLPCILAKGMGASWFERHVTLNRDMWGTDQKASITFDEYKHLIDELNKTDRIIGHRNSGRRVLECEKSSREKLRG